MSIEEVVQGFREQLNELLPQLLIHSVQFDHQDGIVEITFAELRDQADGVGLLKTVALERELFSTEVNALESDLRDLIDEVLVAIRNEDVRKERMDKAIARTRPSAEDED